MLISATSLPVWLAALLDEQNGKLHRATDRILHEFATRCYLVAAPHGVGGVSTLHAPLRLGLPRILGCAGGAIKEFLDRRGNEN